LEMPDATQKIDTGLTMGLLKILHRQVIEWQGKLIKQEDSWK
jgi:hypothetical protein